MRLSGPIKRRAKGHVEADSLLPPAQKSAAGPLEAITRAADLASDPVFLAAHFDRRDLCNWAGPQPAPLREPPNQSPIPPFRAANLAIQ